MFEIKITFWFYINASFCCMVKVKVCKKVWNRCYIKIIWRNHLVLVYAVQCMGYFWQLKNNIFWAWKKAMQKESYFCRDKNDCAFVEQASYIVCMFNKDIKLKSKPSWWYISTLFFFEFIVIHIFLKTYRVHFKQISSHMIT